MVRRTELDPAPLGRGLYPVLTSVVVPRPIAWVSTRSADGVDNIAPHSFFTVASVTPPTLAFTSVGTKDTLRNIRETGEFVVHVVTRGLAEACNATSSNFPPGRSEFAEVGLATEPSQLVGPRRLAASPVALECRASGEHMLGDSVMIFGEIVWAAIDPAVLAADGLVDISRLAPVSRLGREEWGAIGELFSLHRPRFEEPASD